MHSRYVELRVTRRIPQLHRRAIRWTEPFVSLALQSCIRAGFADTVFRMKHNFSYRCPILLVFVPIVPEFAVLAADPMMRNTSRFLLGRLRIRSHGLEKSKRRRRPKSKRVSFALHRRRATRAGRSSCRRACLFQRRGAYLVAQGVAECCSF